MNKQMSWFARNSQQSVFMKVAVIPTLDKSGPVPTITDSKKIKKPEEMYVVVGETVIGGEEVVGDER